MSLVHRNPDGSPVPVLRWSPTKWRKAEAIRDRIMRGVGTDEPWITEELSRENPGTVAVHFRRPLTVMEVAKMGGTPEVRDRPGRA